MAVDGEANVELDDSGEFLSGEARLRLAPGQITQPWDRDTPLRIDHGDFTVRYLQRDRRGRDRPLDAALGQEPGHLQRRVPPVRDANGSAVSWNFSLKANDAALGIAEFGLAPIKVDEWRAKGSLSLQGRPFDALPLRHPRRRRLDRHVGQRGRCAGVAGGQADRAR